MHIENNLTPTPTFDFILNTEEKTDLFKFRHAALSTLNCVDPHIRYIPHHMNHMSNHCIKVDLVRF